MLAWCRHLDCLSEDATKHLSGCHTRVVQPFGRHSSLRLGTSTSNHLIESARQPILSAGGPTFRTLLTIHCVAEATSPATKGLSWETNSKPPCHVHFSWLDAVSSTTAGKGSLDGFAARHFRRARPEWTASVKDGALGASKYPAACHSSPPRCPRRRGAGWRANAAAASQWTAGQD